MERKQLDDLMDKFVRNELSQKELNDLEIQSLIDPNIELELKLRNDISKGIEIVGNEDLRLVLDKIHYQNIKKEEITKRTNLKIWLTLALVLSTVLFFMLSQKIFSKTQPVNNYAEYYEPYIPTISTRGEADQKRISDFGQAYRQKRYERALLIIDPILEESNNELILISAICAMEIKNFKKSNELFDRIINNNDYYFLDHAKWYKALSLLKQDHTEKARSLLNDLAGDENADHHSQAKSLLEDI